jgi:hypothetical protein
MAIFDLTDGSSRSAAKALGITSQQDLDLFERCLSESDADRDADYLLFDTDAGEYTQFGSLSKMLKKDKSVDLSKEIGDTDSERLENFLIRQNYGAFTDFGVPFAFMREVVRTHRLADGWSVVSDYSLNGRSGISSAQLTRHDDYSGSLAEQAWVNLFMATHKKAPESGVVGLTLSVDDND